MSAHLFYHRIDTAQGRLEALYGKQGRSNQFATREDRDAYLSREIAAAQASLLEQRERIERVQSELRAAQQEAEESQTRKDDVDTSLEENKEALLAKSQEKDAVKAQLDEQTERRK